MDITPLVPKGKQVLTGYGAGGFKINNEFISGSILLFPLSCLNWDVTVASHITAFSLQPVLEAAGEVELLLIGTGFAMSLVDSALRPLLKSKGIALDIMDTGAACRTYNVLLAEERRVAAALIAV